MKIKLFLILALTQSFIHTANQDTLCAKQLSLDALDLKIKVDSRLEKINKRTKKSRTDRKALKKLQNLSVDILRRIMLIKSDKKTIENNRKAQPIGLRVTSDLAAENLSIIQATIYYEEIKHKLSTPINPTKTTYTINNKKFFY